MSSELAHPIKAILFVCTGNSCRSVMAEQLAAKLIRDADYPIEVDSAGTMRGGGLTASPETRVVLRRDDIDASEHLSKPLSQDLLDKADLVCVMTKGHYQIIADSFPEAVIKTRILAEFYEGEYASQMGDGIPDPIGMGQVFYDRVYGVIQNSLKNMFQSIEAGAQK
ncbi:MAG: protein-tyrosine-phosphatase [Candidatus Omnitrophota bacterium]|jgi:protein-tyrosine-phosphatase